MDTLDDHILAAYCLEVLDPGEALAMDRWKSDAPMNSLRLGGISAKVGAGPEGICPEVLELAGQQGVLGEGVAHPGDIYHLSFPLHYRPMDVRCVLFRILPETRERIFPTTDGPWPTMEIFPQESGDVRLDVVLQPPYGHQILALVMIPAEGLTLAELDGQAEERLLQALFEKRLPGGTHHVEVSAI